MVNFIASWPGCPSAPDLRGGWQRGLESGPAQCAQRTSRPWCMEQGILAIKDTDQNTTRPRQGTKVRRTRARPVVGGHGSSWLLHVTTLAGRLLVITVITSNRSWPITGYNRWLFGYFCDVPLAVMGCRSACVRSRVCMCVVMWLPVITGYNCNCCNRLGHGLTPCVTTTSRSASKPARGAAPHRHEL